jgi:hypothetical protein
MERTMEQRVNVKFCARLQKSPSETSEMLKTLFDESAVSKSSVSRCHKRFREGTGDVNDDERQDAPATKANGRKCRDNQGTLAM